MYLKTKIHIGRLIGYLIQLLVIVISYWFLRNHFLFMALVLYLLVIPISLTGVIVLRNKLSLEVKCLEKRETRGNTSYIALLVNNNAFFMSFDLSVKLDTENAFYGSEASTVISLPVRFHENYEQHIPVEFSMNGRYRFSVKSFTVRSMLGIISISKKIDSYDEICIFPENVSEGLKSLNDMTLGMTESEETKKKGHDFSDVSDVREYIPGDKLMSIHWKLSAKRDILMVKDRVSMSDQQMVLVAELAPSMDEVDKVITLAYNTCLMLVKEGVYTRFLYWSDKEYEFKEHEIMNMDDLTDTFLEMYFASIYKENDKTIELMRAIYPELRSYVHITAKGGEADAEVIEQD